MIKYISDLRQVSSTNKTDRHILRHSTDMYYMTIILYEICFFFYFQGTEVKAITYSNMQIYDNDKHEVFVIIDIWIYFFN